jgi:hypothetical protein
MIMRADVSFERFYGTTAILAGASSDGTTCCGKK